MENVVNYNCGPKASFFLRQIQGLKCESVGSNVIHENFHIKLGMKSLKMYPMEVLKLEMQHNASVKHWTKQLKTNFWKNNFEVGSTVKGFIRFHSVFQY